MSDDFFDPSSLIDDEHSSASQESEEKSTEESSILHLDQLLAPGTAVPDPIKPDLLHETNEAIEELIANPDQNVSGSVEDGAFLINELNVDTNSTPANDNLNQDKESFPQDALKNVQDISQEFEIIQPEEDEVTNPAFLNPTADSSQGTNPIFSPIPNQEEAGSENSEEITDDIHLQDNGHLLTVSAQLNQAIRMFDLVLTDVPFNALVEQALINIIEATKASVGSVLEYDTKKGDFFFRSAVGGAPEKVVDCRIPKDLGLVGYIFKTKESVNISDASKDSRFLGSIGTISGFTPANCLAAPIIVAGQIYGIIELFDKKGSQTFSDEDLETLKLGTRFTAKILEVRFLTAFLTGKNVG